MTRLSYKPSIFIWLIVIISGVSGISEIVFDTITLVSWSVGFAFTGLTLYFGVRLFPNVFLEKKYETQ